MKWAWRSGESEVKCKGNDLETQAKYHLLLSAQAAHLHHLQESLLERLVSCHLHDGGTITSKDLTITYMGTQPRNVLANPLHVL